MQDLKRRTNIRKIRATSEKDILSSLWAWIANEDNRGTIIGGCTLFGSFMISAHYLWLGITPAFDLGQATLLVLQAFIVGVLLTVYFAAILLAPTFSYKLCGISLSLDPDLRKSQFTLLALRSAGTQLFFGSVVLLLAMDFPVEAKDTIFWGVVLNIGVIGISLVLAIPRMQSGDGQESFWSFLKISGVTGVLTVPSLSMLLLLMIFPSPNERADDFYFFPAWICVVTYASFLGLMGKKNLHAGVLMAGFIFVYILFLLNAVRMPFSGTAYALGLAVRDPVDLVLPEEACKQVKLVLSKEHMLTCDGDQSGLLKGIWLMNTLGERWVLRETPNGENVSFDGKGVTYKRSKKENDRTGPTKSDSDSIELDSDSVKLAR